MEKVAGIVILIFYGVCVYGLIDIARQFIKLKD